MLLKKSGSYSNMCRWYTEIGRGIRRTWTLEQELWKKGVDRYLLAHN